MIALGAATMVLGSKKGKSYGSPSTLTARRSDSSESKPIEAVGAAVAAFVGLTESGHSDTP